MCCGFLKHFENNINDSFGWHAVHNPLNSFQFCAECVYFRYLYAVSWDEPFLLWQFSEFSCHLDSSYVNFVVKVYI